MSYSKSDLAPWARDYDGPAAYAPEDARTAFIRRTYAHLCGAVLLFVAIEAAIFTLVGAETLASVMAPLFAGRWGWLLVVGGFVAVGWIARTWAESEASPAMQYAGLALYTVAEALIFVPILYVALTRVPSALPAAALLTSIIFVGLTAYVFISRADFSGWGHYLWWAGIAAFAIVVAAVVFNFSLGVWFSSAMVALASVYILYDTSNVLHHYRTNQHVAASLALFASLATLFYYVLRILMELNRGRN